MKKIAHIVNPVIVGKSSDLFIAQPVTFASMINARDMARDRVDVRLYTAQYPEDRPLIPSGFTQTPDLERSILDLGAFEKRRKLPFINDILGRLYDAAIDAEYLIYTNVDIGLMPQFYLAVSDIINEGYDAFVINRRTIAKRYKGVEDLPSIYSDVGQSHPGFDCFVFRRDAFPRFILGGVCIGANLVGSVLLLNLISTAENFIEFKDKHLTFHIGDDMAWKSGHYADYAAYNINETIKCIRGLEQTFGSADGGGRYRRLIKYVSSLDADMKKITRGKKAGQLDSHLQTQGAPREAAKKPVVTDQRVICVTGMARSGTSMVAGLLNIMGVYLGPEESLLLETSYNTKGCWEHKAMQEISDAIRAAIQVRGFGKPNWVDSTSIAGFAEKARAVIEKDFAGCKLWGWKDDRCSLTLPFWQRIVPAEMEYVICVRNPLDVAQSLMKAKFMPNVRLDEKLELWLVFTASAIKNTQGKRRHIVMYEDCMGKDAMVNIKRIAEFLGPSYARDFPKYEERINKFISKDLQHHNTTLVELFNNADVTYMAKCLYYVLYNYAKLEKDDPEASQIVDATAAMALNEVFNEGMYRRLVIRRMKNAKSWLNSVIDSPDKPS